MYPLTESLTQLFSSRNPCDDMEKLFPTTSWICSPFSISGTRIVMKPFFCIVAASYFIYFDISIYIFFSFPVLDAWMFLHLLFE
jgi:hypothetical protein